MPSDTSEKGLEIIIEKSLLDNGWTQRHYTDYNREHAIDEEMLKAFLTSTQNDTVERSRIFSDTLEHNRFIARLKSEISTRGIIDVLRHGLAHKSYNFILYYPTPSAANPKATAQYKENRWLVTRQVRYSLANENAIDMVLSLNGLPFITLELKNTLSGEHVREAIDQYQKDRSHK